MHAVSSSKPQRRVLASDSDNNSSGGGAKGAMPNQNIAGKDSLDQVI